MLTYSFENIGEESLYEHLYRCIRADILAGRLQAGEKLPSKRSLARQLGISVITVEGAYGQLVAEGYCQSVPKRDSSSRISRACPSRPHAHGAHLPSQKRTRPRIWPTSQPTACAPRISRSRHGRGSCARSWPSRPRSS